MLFQYAQNSTDYALNYAPKFAYYAQTMPIISRRSKLVCSNNCITLLCTSQFHHQSKTRSRRLLGDLYTSRLHGLYLSRHLRTRSLVPAPSMDGTRY